MKQSKSQIIASIVIESLLYIVASLALFQGFQILCTDLYDFTHILMVWPMFLSYLLITYWLFVYHALLHEPSEEARKKLSFGNSIGLTAAGSILLILVFVNIFMGNYVMGWVDLIFPIDIILIDVITIAFGLLLMIKKEPVLKRIPGLANENGVPKAMKIISSIFGGLYVLIEEYLFGGWILGGFNIDEFGMLICPLMICCFLGSLVMLLREIAIAKKNLDGVKPLSLMIVSLVFDVLVLFFGIYVIATNFSQNSDYIALNFQWFFVLDYISSLNIAPYVTSLLPIAACLIYSANASLSYFKNKK